MQRNQEIQNDEFFRKLNASADWIDLRIITPEVLADIKLIYEKELEELKKELKDEGILEEHSWELSFFHDDHYRYYAFKRFLKENHPIPPEIIMALYKIGEKDHDHTIGRTIVRDLLDEENCPMELLELALQSKEEFLIKAANWAIKRRNKSS